MSRVNNSAKFFQEDRVYLSWSFLEKKKSEMETKLKVKLLALIKILA